MQRFNDKFALITGGTNGMGFATAQQFINEGGKVIITGRSAETVNKAVAQLGTNAFWHGVRCGKYERYFPVAGTSKAIHGKH